MAIRDDSARARELREQLEGSSNLPPSFTTLCTIGTDALKVLKKEDKILVFTGPRTENALSSEAIVGEPIANHSVLEKMRSCSSESELVQIVMPMLLNARRFDMVSTDPCALVLVNSENQKWLDSLEKPLPLVSRRKPDLFVTWAPFVHGSKFAPRSFYGKLAAARMLQNDGCVREFYEAKRGDDTLTAADLGQLIDYHSRVRGNVLGMVFNARFIWLLKTNRDKPLQLIKSEWSTPGSLAMLRTFFDSEYAEPKLVRLLRQILEKLNLTLCRINAAGSVIVAASGVGGSFAADDVGGVDCNVSEGGDNNSAVDRTRESKLATVGSAFLGAGASARVFAVRRGNDDTIYALKVSLEPTYSALEYEFRQMQEAFSKGARPSQPLSPTHSSATTRMKNTSAAAFCSLMCIRAL